MEQSRLTSELPLEEESPGPTALTLDRATPGWGGVLSVLCASISAGAVLVLILSGLFLQQMVAIEHDRILAPLLVGVSVVPAVAIVLIELAHARALAGLSHGRARTSRRTRAAIGVALGVVLAVVHPLLALGPGVGAVISGAAVAFVRRRRIGEPIWDYRPEEAVGLLAGRDIAGLALANQTRMTHPVLDSILAASAWFSVAVAFACGSWLISTETLGPTALSVVAFFTYWSVSSIGSGLRLRIEPDPRLDGLADQVLERERDDPAGRPDTGLVLEDVTVCPPDGPPLVSVDRLVVTPGQVIGLIGDSGSGKTLLLRTIAAPFDLDGLHVSGHVTLEGQSLWRRRPSGFDLPLCWLPSPPLMLAASGAVNLSGGAGGQLDAIGRRTLEQFVFSSARVSAICAQPDARRLPSADQAALVLARAFTLGPRLFLMDHPEDGLSEKTVGVLAERIRREQRAGRSFLIITDHRRLGELCDHLLVMQGGRIIDRGTAEEIQARSSNGWSRFVGQRALETEANLTSWLRSQFVRDNDEGNRRKVSTIGAELLLLSCQTAPAGQREEISFDFKHYEGHCVLRLRDAGTVLNRAQIEQARQSMTEAAPTQRLAPLQVLLRDAQAFDLCEEDGGRVIEVQVSTYDPRKRAARAQ